MMSNRELFDMLITRTTSCKSITPQRTLTKMLGTLELFLENWGWFDDDESTPRNERRYLWGGRKFPSNEEVTKFNSQFFNWFFDWE
jgi:hypothetical protein